MATRRKGAAEQPLAEKEASSSAAREGNNEVLKQQRKTLKAQVLLKSRQRRDALRWMIVVVLLLLALLGLYYYLTRYYVKVPTVVHPQDRSSNTTTEGAAEEGKRKSEEGKRKSEEGGKRKSEEEGKRKSEEGGKRKTEEEGKRKSEEGKRKTEKGKSSSSDKKKDTSTGKSKPDKGSRSPPSKTPSAPAGRPERAESADGKWVRDSEGIREEVDLSKVRLLKRPVPAMDPDRPFIIEILMGDNMLEAKRYNDALERFNEILKQFPQSPRALFGKGQALEGLAGVKKSNKLLDTSLEFYEKASSVVTNNDDIKAASLSLMANVAERRGRQQVAITALEKLYKLREGGEAYAKRLGLAYLKGGSTKKAMSHFKSVLEKSPDDSFAKSHLGFILFLEKKYEEALPLLLEGIRKDPTIRTNAKFYLYAGEALNKLDRTEEAFALYGEAVSLGLFPSAWQRSLFNERGLRGSPWWEVGDTGYAEEGGVIAGAVTAIADEARTVLDGNKGVFEGGKHQFILFSKGKKDASHCQTMPQTCELIESFPAAASCKVGEVKLVALPPRIHVPPHTGPTNTRLELLLPLSLSSAEEDPVLRIRAAEDTRTLLQGELVVLDDSFEQELWYDGSETAILLVINVWHPDLPEEKQKQLKPI